MKINQRKTISILIIWTFINSFLIICGFYLRQGGTYSPIEEFVPLTGWSQNDFKGYIFNTLLKYFDFSEFFVYVVGAWMVFYLNRFITKKSD